MSTANLPSLTHAARHTTGGLDPLSPAGIGAVAGTALAPLPAACVPVSVGGVVSAQSSVQSAAGTARVPYLLTRSVTDLRLLYTNWFINGMVDTDNTADLVIAASIEVAGTIYRVFFAGAITATIKPGASAIADPIPVDLPAGTTIYVRTYTSGTAWHANRYANVAGSGGFTTTTDLTAPGSAAIADASSFTALIGPAAILGAPAAAPGVASPRVSLLGVGDSIMYGQGDGVGNGPGVNTNTQLLGAGGWLGRAAATAGVGLANIGVQTDTATNWTLLASRVRRLSLGWLGTTAVCAYGRNDVSTGRTLAQIQADLVTIWTHMANRGKRVAQTTITPKTTSTDGWLTTAAQTIAANESVRLALNAWLRDGAPMVAGAAVAVGTSTAARAQVNSATGALVTSASGGTHLLTGGILEVADTVETARDSGLWRPPTTTRTVTDLVTTAASTGITSATAAFTAADRGRTIVINGAGTSGGLYVGTILTVSSATNAALYQGTPTAISGATATIAETYSQDGTHPQPTAAAAMTAAAPAALLAA